MDTGLYKRPADTDVHLLTKIRCGTVARANVGFAVPLDLIVIASHGQSGMARRLPGRVAEEIVRNGNYRTMLVRADWPDEHDEPSDA